MSWGNFSFARKDGVSSDVKSSLSKISSIVGLDAGRGVSLDDFKGAYSYNVSDKVAIRDMSVLMDGGYVEAKSGGDYFFTNKGMNVAYPDRFESLSPHRSKKNLGSKMCSINKATRIACGTRDPRR